MLEARSVSVSRVQYAGSILAPHNVHTQPVTAEGARATAHGMREGSREARARRFMTPQPGALAKVSNAASQFAACGASEAASGAAGLVRTSVEPPPAATREIRPELRRDQARAPPGAQPEMGQPCAFLTPMK